MIGWHQWYDLMNMICWVDRKLLIIAIFGHFMCSSMQNLGDKPGYDARHCLTNTLWNEQTSMLAVEAHMFTTLRSVFPIADTN